MIEYLIVCAVLSLIGSAIRKSSIVATLVTAVVSGPLIVFIIVLLVFALPMSLALSEEQQKKVLSIKRLHERDKE